MGIPSLHMNQSDLLDNTWFGNKQQLITCVQLAFTMLHYFLIKTLSPLSLAVVTTEARIVSRCSFVSMNHPHFTQRSHSPTRETKATTISLATSNNASHPSPPSPASSAFSSVNCDFNGIMRAVDCVTTQINNPDSPCEKHFTILTQSGANCGTLQLCDEGRRGGVGTEKKMEWWGACGLTNEFPRGVFLMVGRKTESVMVWTIFRLSFCAERTLKQDETEQNKLIGSSWLWLYV